MFKGPVGQLHPLPRLRRRGGPRRSDGHRSSGVSVGGGGAPTSISPVSRSPARDPGDGHRPSSSVPGHRLRVNLRRQPLPRQWGNGSPQRQCLYIQADSGLVANNLVYRDPNGFGIQVRGNYPTGHGRQDLPNMIVDQEHRRRHRLLSAGSRREQLLGRPSGNNVVAFIGR